LQNRVQTLQQQQAPLAAQANQLRLERDEAAKQLASLKKENDRLRRDAAETPLLRAEVASARSGAQELAQLKAATAGQKPDPMESAARALLGKMNVLKQRLAQSPERNIPELKYLDDETWARIAQSAGLESDADVRRAMASLRDIAKQQFGPAMGQDLQKYAQANSGQLPADVSQLKPYFDSPVDDATLQRYQMLKAGNLSDLQPNDLIVGEKAPVDDQYDNIVQIGLNILRTQGVGENTGHTGSRSWSSTASRVPAADK